MIDDGGGDDVAGSVLDQLLKLIGHRCEFFYPVQHLRRNVLDVGIRNGVGAAGIVANPLRQFFQSLELLCVIVIEALPRFVILGELQRDLRNLFRARHVLVILLLFILYGQF